MQIKKPSKCPVCRSSKITMNELGDMSCKGKNCNYTRLSEETLNKKLENDNRNNKTGNRQGNNYYLR